MRDMFTHKITTPQHWNMLIVPTAWTRAELEYDLIVGADTVVLPSYDPHCVNVDISGGCEPVAVISAEKLRDDIEGKNETAAIANILRNDPRMGQYVIEPETWDCIWEELILNGKGLKTVYDRPHAEISYSFSAEMLEKMISELNYLIDKYSGPDWITKATANRIVELITEHRSEIQEELEEVVSGRRVLSTNDFLGPKMRAERRRYRLEGNVETGALDNAREGSKYADYFFEMQKKIEEKKQIQRMARAARVHRRRRDRVKELIKQGKLVNEDRHSERLRDLAEWRKFLRENRGDWRKFLG